MPRIARSVDPYFESASRGGLTWVVGASATTPDQTAMLDDFAADLEAVAAIGNAGMLAGVFFPAEESHIEALTDSSNIGWSYRGTAISPGAARIVLNIVERLRSRGLFSVSLSFSVGASDELIPGDVVRKWPFPGAPRKTSFELINEMLDPPPNYPVVRFQFRTPIDDALLSTLERLARAWERVVNAGGFSESIAKETLVCEVTHSEMYVVMPAAAEYSLVGLFDRFDIFSLWIAAANKLAKGLNPLISLELE